VTTTVTNTSSPAATVRLSPRQIAWLTAWLLPLVLVPLWMLCLVWLPLGGVNVVGSGASIVLAAMLVTCTLTDLSWRKIPNWATFTGLAWALGLAGLSDLTALEPPLAAVSWTDSLSGTVCCLGIMLVIYSLAGGGAGDVKLLAAVGAFLGVRLGIQALIGSYLVAATAVVAWGIWKIGLWRLISAFARQVGAIVLPLSIDRPESDARALLNQPMPLGPAIAIGTIAALAMGDLMP